MDKEISLQLLNGEDLVLDCDKPARISSFVICRKAKTLIQECDFFLPTVVSSRRCAGTGATATAAGSTVCSLNLK